MSTIIDFIGKVREQGVATYNLVTGESSNKKFLALLIGSTERFKVDRIKTEKIASAYVYDEVAKYVAKNGGTLNNPKYSLQGEKRDGWIELSIGVSDQDMDVVEYLNNKQKIGE